MSLWKVKRTPLNSQLAGEDKEGGLVGWEEGGVGGRSLWVTVLRELTCQRHDSLLNPGSAVSGADYFCITST